MRIKDVFHDRVINRWRWHAGKPRMIVALTTCTLLPVGLYAASSQNEYGLFAFTPGTVISSSEVNENFEVLGEHMTTFEGAIAIDEAGDVGIGTTNPTVGLHLNGGKNLGIQVDGTWANPGCFVGTTQFRAANPAVLILPTGTFSTTSDRWKVLMMGSWADDYHGAGAYPWAGWMEFTDQYPSRNINGRTITISKDANDEFVAFSDSWSAFSGQVIIVPNFGTGTEQVSIDARGMIVAGDDVIRLDPLGNSFIRTGNVGIGTTSPSSRLQVGGGYGGGGLADNLSLEHLNPSAYGDGPALSLDGTYQGSPWKFGRIAALNSGDGNYGTDMVFYGKPNNGQAGNLVERVRIKYDGNVGLGVEPSYPLHMASGAHVTEGGVWTDASSRTLKQNIRSLEADDALAALTALRPTRFQYTREKDEEHLGFIAEEVPQLVAMNDRKSLSPMDIVAVLTRVTQEQEKSLLKTRTALEAQRAELAAQRSLLADQQALVKTQQTLLDAQQTQLRAQQEQLEQLEARLSRASSIPADRD